MDTSSSPVIYLLTALVLFGPLVDSQLTEEERIKQVRDVTTPPRIETQPPKEKAYKREEEVVLECTASGNPEPSFSWLFNGAELADGVAGVRLVAGQGTLVISDPQQQHEGIYQCRAHNNYGTALSVITQLRMAMLDPFPSLTVKEHYPLVGEYLKLVCEPPDSYPRPSVYWGEGNPEAKVNEIATNDRVILDYDGNLHFANIESGDNLHGSHYVCVGNNLFLRSLVQGDDQKIIPKIQAVTPEIKPPELRWNSGSPMIMVQGDTLKMKCIFSGYPTPRVSWRRVDRGELPPTAQLSNYNLDLTITNVQLADAGIFACTATNSRSGLSVQHNMEVRVETRPIWVKKPESVDTSEDERAEFHCQAGGIPKPTIIWTRNGVELESIPNPRRRILNGGELIQYSAVSKADAAVLQCNISNRHGYEFHNAYLNVLAEPPTFIQPPQSLVKGVEGQEAVLACEVYGAPKPLVTWTVDGRPLSGSRFSIDTRGKIAGNLTINPAHIGDSGTYTCQATNKFGNVEGTGQLIVRNRTELLVLPEDQEVLVGSTVRMHCSAHTDDAEQHRLTISWRKDGSPINFSLEPRLYHDPADNSLVVTGASVLDSGNFTCVADNGLDSAEHTARLLVKGPPGAPRDLGLTNCQTRTALLEWDAGAHNNDPITHYTAYYRTDFDPPAVAHEAVTVPADTTFALVELTPWTNYKFFVRAFNSLGGSEESNNSTVCHTMAQPPDTNPGGVCTDTSQPHQLIITWQRVPREQHYGPEFGYEVSYRLLDETPEAQTHVERVRDWQQTRLVMYGQPIYRRYRVSVRARNSEGTTPAANLTYYIAYSGEDAPRVTPTGLAVVSVTATNATFHWDAIDPSPDNIHGFFVGYRIVYWRADAPDERRTKDVIEHDEPECPLEEVARRRRQTEGGSVRGSVSDLWPYSSIRATVMVLNRARTGAHSDTISFNTPEGPPGLVTNARIIQTGSYHLTLTWLPPVEQNGIITGYTILYKEAEKLSRPPRPTELLPPHTTRHRLRRLKPDTSYELTVHAHTAAGEGAKAFLLDTTKPASPPDAPAVAGVVYGNRSAVVSWRDSVEQPSNPGSEFFVRYRIKGNDTWLTVTPVDDDADSITVADLEEGAEYEVVVVAVNGHGSNHEETPSEPYVFLAGPREGPSSDIEEPALAKIMKMERQQQKVAVAGWMVGLLCFLILLLLIILIICLVRRNRGGKYPVHEKEKLRGRPDDPEDRMGEYNNQPYMPLDTKSDPELAGALESTDRETEPLAPGDSNDSLAEYEDTDPTKFNEDGSFIGAYGDGGFKKNETSSPLSTFV